MYTIIMLSIHTYYTYIRMKKSTEMEVANTQLPVCFETVFVFPEYFAYARF